MSTLFDVPNIRKFMAVLDFRSAAKRRKKPYFTGRRWLFWLILLMGATVIIADKAREPGAWRWLDWLVGCSDKPPAGYIDNRLSAVSRGNFSEDSFIIAKPESSEKRLAADNGYFTGVDPALLDSVRDDTFDSRDDRAPALALLNVLNTTEEQELRASSTGRITYAQLFNQPAYYRGRLVTVAGVVRRVKPFELPKNKYGVHRYNRAWLFPIDNPRSPVIIYCLQLPDGFPVGTAISEQAEVVGFFFKKEAYMAQDTLRTAPMILAKTLQWEKRPAIVEEPRHDVRTIILIAAAAALLALMTAWFVHVRTRPSHPVLPDRPPDFELMKEMDRGNDTNHEK
ncbi:MAG: hypothetical protein JW959_09615 [Pirellulales bacterium]|nr:hypothetical protein [Pirellulales bacterium]